MISVDDQILVYTDLKNLEYFNTIKTLNCRQHHWAEFLQPFNFKVIYMQGRLNEKADALSRRRDYRAQGGSNSEHFTFSPRTVNWRRACHLATTCVGDLPWISVADNIS